MPVHIVWCMFLPVDASHDCLPLRVREQQASFIPLPRLWDDSLEKLRRRCHIDATEVCLRVVFAKESARLYVNWAMTSEYGGWSTKEYDCFPVSLSPTVSFFIGLIRLTLQLSCPLVDSTSYPQQIPQNRNLQTPPFRRFS